MYITFTFTILLFYFLTLCYGQDVDSNEARFGLRGPLCRLTQHLLHLNNTCPDIL
uniref:Seminal fluid protein HACP023 n=1 Tax=Heliconius erato TaxID=33431 RepID=D9HQ37_HELEA|nr:seminal fluid protein HACP023 [Heliconius erato]